MEMYNSPNRSRFLTRQVFALFCLTGLALALITIQKAAAQGQSSNPSAVQGIYRGLAPVVKFDVSPPLRDMAMVVGPGQLRENEDRDVLPWVTRFAPEIDPVAQEE